MPFFLKNLQKIAIFFLENCQKLLFFQNFPNDNCLKMTFLKFRMPKKIFLISKKKKFNIYKKKLIWKKCFFPRIIEINVFFKFTKKNYFFKLKKKIKEFLPSKMSFLNNCHFGNFWQFSRKKWQFSGNFWEKNSNFLAIFGLLNGNFPEGQDTTQDIAI